LLVSIFSDLGQRPFTEKCAICYFQVKDSFSTTPKHLNVRTHSKTFSFLMEHGDTEMFSKNLLALQ